MIGTKYIINYDNFDISHVKYSICNKAFVCMETYMKSKNMSVFGFYFMVLYQNISKIYSIGTYIIPTNNNSNPTLVVKCASLWATVLLLVLQFQIIFHPHVVI